MCQAQTLALKTSHFSFRFSLSIVLFSRLLSPQHLSQQIQNSRVSGAFSVGVSGTQITQCLLNIYRDLRENPLIIM